MDSPTLFRMAAADRKAFRLFILQGKSEREAANIMRVSPSTAHERKLEIYRQLRALFEAELENL
jgi:DNA-directed RNA polymerase specialized sigma24 family protein